MRSERFHSLTIQNGMKFGRDQKVEFKKSFKLYRQNLLNVLMKVGYNYVQFARTKVGHIEAKGLIDTHICLCFMIWQHCFCLTIIRNL
jgi:hypothetical protein